MNPQLPSEEFIIASVLSSFILSGLLHISQTGIVENKWVKLGGMGLDMLQTEFELAALICAPRLI